MLQKWGHGLLIMWRVRFHKEVGSDWKHLESPQRLVILDFKDRDQELQDLLVWPLLEEHAAKCYGHNCLVDMQGKWFEH